MDLAVFRPNKINTLIPAVLVIAGTWFLRIHREGMCATVDCRRPLEYSCAESPISIIPRCCGCYSWPVLFQQALATIFIFTALYLLISIIQEKMRK